MTSPIDWAQFPTIGQARDKAEWAFVEIARLHAESDSLRATVNDMRALNAQLSANAAAKLMEMRDRAEKAEASNAQMQRCLNFFASVIKSGESWSGTCEQEYRAAQNKGDEK